MADVMQAIWRALAELAQSDLRPAPAPRWHIILTGQMAHILIGVALAFYRVPMVLVRAVFCGWIAKELLRDIPNSGGAVLVYADSMADVAFAALGFWTVRKKWKTCP